MGLCCLAGLIPSTTSKLQLWQDVSADETLAGGGEDKLRHGVLTASGAGEGHVGGALSRLSLSAPRTFNFVERKAKTARRKTLLTASSAKVWLCVGFL